MLRLSTFGREPDDGPQQLVQSVPYGVNDAPPPPSPGVITNAMLSDMPEATVKGRAAGTGTGDPQDLNAALLKAILALVAGDISGLGFFATGTDAANLSGTLNPARIAANALALSKLVTAGAASILGATAAGNYASLTPAQAKGVLAIVAGDVGGLGVFATGTDAANLTGTIAAARLPQFTGGDVTTGGAGSVNLTLGNGTVTLAKQANMATASLVYRKTAGSGAPEVNTLATLKTDLGLTGTNSGDQFTAMTSARLLGRATAGFGAAEELTLGGNVSVAGGALNVTFSATDRLLGRSTAGAGNAEEIVCTAAGRALIDDADAAAQRVTLGVNKRGAMVKRSADLVAVDLSTGATIAFDAEVWDTDSVHDLVTNNGRLSVPAGVTSVEVGATITFGNVDTVTPPTLSVIIRKNGLTSFDGACQDQRKTASASPAVNLRSGPIPVVGGTDYFELVVFMQTDTSVDVVAARTNFWLKVVE